MKDNLFKLLVVGLLTAILTVTLSRNQTGRYVNIEKTASYLDTTDGTIYTSDGYYELVKDSKKKGAR